MIDKLIKHKKTILLTGESGTGKTTWTYRTFGEHRLFHVNICEIEDSLFMSHLFGHKKGSFTGAHSDYEGIVAKANHGILFLDEIGDISLLVQKKLLMFIETKTYYSVGSNELKAFRGQIVLATNKNLDELVRKGEFREDLYFRIKAFEFQLEPLRQKANRSDFIKKEIQRTMEALSETRTISQAALSKFFTYPWPGNYRELKSTIEYVLFNSRETIDLSILPAQMLKEQVSTAKSFEEAKNEFETKFLQSSLMKYNYKINKTAREIGISKITLLKRIKKYQLVKNDI